MMPRLVELTPLERRQFYSPAELRAQAVEQGRKANEATRRGDQAKARACRTRARDLAVAALALETTGVLQGFLDITTRAGRSVKFESRRGTIK